MPDGLSNNTFDAGDLSNSIVCLKNSVSSLTKYLSLIRTFPRHFQRKCLVKIKVYIDSV